MAQQLPLVQIPMPQGQQQSYNLPPLQMPQPQVVANVSPQTMAIAGAQRKGIDWAGLLGNLGSYVAAAGSAYGTGANPSQGLLNAANAIQTHTQNIRQFDTMKPYYQQMGYDVSQLDPRRGGAGVATTPMEMAKLQSGIEAVKALNEYRQGSLDLKLQLGLLGDNTKRANIINSLLNSGTITPQEAVKHMQDYGITFGDMSKSNQTRNADINQYLAPARKSYYESAPAIAGARLGLQQAEFGVDAPYKQAQTAKIMGEMYKPYAEKQLKSQETLNNIDYAENLIKSNKNLVGVYSPLTAQVGRLTGGTIGMSKAGLANRGEIARTIGTIKNDLLTQARNSGQTGINTMAEINQATAKKKKNSSAEELLGALKSMRRIANRNIMETPRNISPFMPNDNLTPIPRNAFITSKPKPRTTSKP